MPEFSGVSHVALTVSNLDVSVPWYQRLFDANSVMQMGEPGDQMRLNGLLTPNGLLIVLNQHASTQGGDRFSEFRVGLDHLSFACADQAAVDAWRARLDELGIPNSGTKDAGYAYVLVFRDPDNVQLKFFAGKG